VVAMAGRGARRPRVANGKAEGVSEGEAGRSVGARRRSGTEGAHDLRRHRL
jgi:hypothetical protein